MTKVKVVLANKNAKLPTYGSSGAACFDLYACENAVVSGPTLVNTGLQMEIPEGYYLEIRPRSGLSREGVLILNSPGTVDSDYRGEIKVLMCALNHNIKIGDRIAQGMFCPVLKLDMEVSNTVNETERGSRGFGSTGV